jgi:hypothetical protein
MIFRRSLVLVALLIFVFTIGSIHAQEGAEVQCTSDDLNAALGPVIDQLTAAQTQDAAAAYESIVAARESLAALDSSCLGLDFEGTADTVSDPAYVPAGLYRVTVVTEGYFILKSLVVEGECEGTSYGSLFAVTEGRAKTGAQAAFKSDGCTVIWETSSVSAPYAVSFERMK